MKRSILVLFWVFVSAAMFAQGGIDVAGIVLDEQGQELIGVSVQVKGKQDVGVVTDFDGRFKLSGIPAGSTLVYSYIGYVTREIKYTATKLKEKIALKEAVNEFDEVVVVGRDTQRKVSVVGAITNVDPAGIQAPAVSVSNMLGGRVPGIIAVTRSGEPGNNFSEFWIRGISTFGASSSALVLVDGIEGNINDLDPADIESFSILKDASATAVYGTRGANGVVVVTTKRGKAGKLHVNFKTNATYSYSPRMPEYTDAYQYATLANEARSVRGDDPVYSATELELFKTGLDPDLYPNVNWRDVILKDHVINNQHHLSISGGGQSARYYMSLGILNSEALFKQDKSASKHDVNVNYHKYNFRTNIDADLTKTTMLSLNLEAVIKTQNAPGTGSSNKYLWESQANLPPTVVPVRYSNGQLPAYGTNLEDKSPYVRLNYMGYTTNETYSTKINVGLSQDLGMITEGLSVRGLFSFSMNGAHIVDRHMNPEQYYADPKDGRYLDGSLKTVRTVNKEDMTATQGSASNRELYFEAAANYKRLFNQDHRVTGLAHFYRQELTNVDWGNGVLVSIPKRYQALSFRGTYSYKDTYFVEGNLGYTGSENFNKERRYGWFPSISGGWVPTQYDWYRNLLPFNNFLKFRASWGRVGNDRLKEGNVDIRFPYLTTLGSVNSTWGNAIAENRTGSMNLKWEVSTKTNFGIDARFFDDKIDMTVDFFHTKTTDIFQKRANIPDESGLSNVLPYANIGSMKSWGMDGTLAYTHTFNKDMSLTVRGNFTHAENEVIYWEQSGVNYPYQSYSGVPYGVQRGLIALGLFKDEDDIKSSPKQTFMDNYRPGDIKYKDVNGDGKIDTDDVVPLNYSNVPFIQYGFALDWNYKAFRVSILFEGVSKVQYFQGGLGFYPFYKESRGNLLTMVANPANRWIPREYAEANGIDLALAENPNAKFPRLTYGDNANNNRQSTFWLADGKYLRLKNVDVSYRFTNNWLKSRVGVESATLSLIGENLHVWDKVKLFDPSQASGNGAEYPLQRMYTLQLNLTF
ncbi:TonB-dependent receptor [Bacteroides thetaiotaomicron]|uniref:SusC/RagA family TonB-linked outer membrane protein n=1 Tax=Bacteroides thetaiotaomicron TaxID=818 RepID=UPI001C387140|nr:TonB-dependent receptor [Bacteroides thetaiotaomicron]MBV4310382.1 TonB-dependent receptor [Bacteroides thetaiotaomicron]MBV4329246.1 TonB-dependent receptor [Bacteroides thetaiotaomicron]MCB7382760.1 TonB-dependent receptor [Bacteroides thetaiotaomicron]MCG4882433.1 TonB-dependent receptor [Bacteroides thetaiotaomicron]MCQ5249089.1 TonB-dependent receptor [Bacteroides thetaiotaomicron]